MAAPTDKIEQYQSGSEMALDSTLFNQLEIEFELYRQEIQKCQKNFDSSDAIQYYILSTKFIKQWVQLHQKASQENKLDGSVNVKLPQQMNIQLIESHLKDFNEYELRKDAREGIDFKFVNRQVMQIFEMYRGPRIPRRAYFHGIQKLIEVYPIKFEFLYVSDAVLKQVRNTQSSKCTQNLKIYRSLAYKNQKVCDLLYRLIEYRKKSALTDQKQSQSARIYATQKQFTIEDYAKGLRDIDNKQRQYMELPGDQLRQDMIIGDLNIPQDFQPIMILQLQSKKWIYNPPHEKGSEKHQRCEFCRKYTILKYACKCKQVQYCCQRCLDSDYKYHVQSCSKVMEQESEDPKFQRTKNSKYGLVGLQNLGNTCYMNSALQCLQHTKDLTGYFASKNYLLEINQDNPIGSKGKLLRSYARFINNMLTTTQSSIAPSKLKYTVGKTKQMFMGYEQHDSGEFLLFLLDTLHEDLNRVKNKPYCDGVQNNGRPDQQVAKESWFFYLKRNQSYINDLMGGQYRSQVKCPDCKQISVTFDPFLIFTVPIPTNEAKSTNIYYFFSNYEKPTLKMTLNSKNNLVGQLRQDAATKAKTSLQQTKFFILGFNGPIRQVSDTETVDRIINQKQFDECGQQRQLFALQLSPQQLQNIQNKKYLIFKFLADSNFPKTQTFKRPFPLICKNLKGSNLYDRICRFLLILSHKFSTQVQKTQLQSKYIVFRQKSRQKQMFKIYMTYGNPKQTMNSITYENKVEITEQTDVQKLLEENKYEVEFEVLFKDKPYLDFNSFKNYTKDDSFEYYSYKPGSQQKYTLQECLHEMKKPEQLVQGNQVFCYKCQDLKLAEKTMQMYKASKYLVLQLRRFKQVGYEKMKNYAHIQFPLQLELKDDLINPSLPQTYFKDCKTQEQEQIFIKPKYWKGFNQNKSTKYRLYGIVNHHGTLTGGHYTAYAKHDEKWYQFDDSRVNEIDQQKIVTSAAYLLFYQRMDIEDAWPTLEIVEKQEDQIQMIEQNTNQDKKQEDNQQSQNINQSNSGGMDQQNATVEPSQSNNTQEQQK